MAGKSPKNRGLGRGLDALFADQTPISEGTEEVSQKAADGNTVVYIDI